MITLLSPRMMMPPARELGLARFKAERSEEETRRIEQLNKAVEAGDARDVSSLLPRLEKATLTSAFQQQLLLKALETSRPYEIVKALLAAKAEPLTTEEKLEVLQRAVTNKKPKSLRLLILNRFPINGRDASNWSPLMYAAYYGLTNIATILRLKGATATVKELQLVLKKQPRSASADMIPKLLGITPKPSPAASKAMEPAGFIQSQLSRFTYPQK